MIVEQSRTGSTRDKPPTLRAVLAFMQPASLAYDRRGTAAIEFALILPVMLLLGVGLVDTVFRNLLMIDVEMAANTGARMALQAGASQDRIAGVMAEFTDADLEMQLTALQCGRDTDIGKKYKLERLDIDGNKETFNKLSGAIFNSADSTKKSSDACKELPYGRYVKITAATHHISLLGVSHSTAITAVDYVRLP